MVYVNEMIALYPFGHHSIPTPMQQHHHHDHNDQHIIIISNDFETIPGTINDWFHRSASISLALVSSFVPHCLCLTNLSFYTLEGRSIKYIFNIQRPPDEYTVLLISILLYHLIFVLLSSSSFPSLSVYILGQSPSQLV